MMSPIEMILIFWETERKQSRKSPVFLWMHRLTMFLLAEQYRIQSNIRGFLAVSFSLAAYIIKSISDPTSIEVLKRAVGQKNVETGVDA